MQLLQQQALKVKYYFLHWKYYSYNIKLLNLSIIF
jgi:hypothetical protein